MFEGPTPLQSAHPTRRAELFFVTLIACVAVLAIPSAHAAKVDLGLVGVEADVKKGGVDVGVSVPPAKTDVNANLNVDEGGVDVDVGVNTPAAGVNVDADVGSGSGGNSSSSTSAGSDSSGSGSGDKGSGGSDGASRGGGSNSPAARTAAADDSSNASSRSRDRATKESSESSSDGSGAAAAPDGTGSSTAGESSPGANPANDVESSIISRFVAYVPDWIWAIVGVLLVGMAIAFGWALRERRRRRMSDGIALRDPLTEVGNVKAFKERLAQEWSVARRHDETFGVMVIDLDLFKEINDEHGHAAGDAVLVDTAKRLTRFTRDSDFVARIGGDEFAVICPRTDMDGLRSLRTQIESRTAGSSQIEVGYSIGVAELRQGDVAPADVVERADLSMYRRKRGRKAERKVAATRTATAA